jgi:hypothetical protein
LGIETPEKRCGKTTLLGVLSELVSRPVVAANISSPAFFRVIEETQPTLLIDEADTFLQGSDELRGILNAGYCKKTAFVWRVTDGGNFKFQQPTSKENEDGDDTARNVSLLTPAAPSGSRVAKFSCWCPKAVCSIGRLPDTLADRCIVIRMQRKREEEECKRLRDLDGTALRERCGRFVSENGSAIAMARPELPEGLNDRAEDIWEPLLVLADLAGGDWPEKARQAAVNLTTKAQDTNPIGSLLMDIFAVFMHVKCHRIEKLRKSAGPNAQEAAKKAQHEAERIFSRDLVDALNLQKDRPWLELARGRPITEMWLAQRLRPYGIRPRMVRIEELQSRGYDERDFWEVFRRYIPNSEVEELRQRLRE